MKVLLFLSLLIVFLFAGIDLCSVGNAGICAMAIVVVGFACALTLMRLRMED